MMTWFKKKEEDRTAELEAKIEKLEKERLVLKEQVENLRIEKKISEEDIKHMVKMKEERLQIEFEKRVAEEERKAEESVARVKDEYRNKLEKNLIQQKDDILKMYSEILQRLPDVSARLRVG